MALYTKQSQVDYRVKDILAKASCEEERRMKGFSIAHLYFQVGAYNKARHYLAEYMKVQPAAASAHKLHGQILSALGMRSEALASWEKAHSLDSLQNDVVMMACRLVLELPAGSSDVRVWLERAERSFPRDPIVFRLKEHSIDSSLADKDVQQLEQILAAGIAAQPLEVGAHCRLVDLLVRSDRLQDAYEYVSRVEERRPFTTASRWHDTVVTVCQKYGSVVTDKTAGSDLLITHLSALEQLIELQLTDKVTSSRLLSLLFAYDQLLHKAVRSEVAPDVSDQSLLERTAFLEHATGQLFFHIATALLYCAKQSGDDLREPADMASVLYLAALSKQPLNTVSKLYQLSSKQSTLGWWRVRAACRVVESDGCLSALTCSDDKYSRLLTLQRQYCTQNGADRIYSRVFRDYNEATVGRAGSALIMLPAFLESCAAASSSQPQQQLTIDPDLRAIYSDQHADCLSRLVWLQLHQQPDTRDVSGACRRLQLPFGPSAVMNGGGGRLDTAPESLTRLDLLCFLHASVYTAEKLETSRDRDVVVPPSIADPVCSEQQTKWWEAAFQLYSPTARMQNFGESRRTMIQGLAVIRCQNQHNNTADLLVSLADWCQQQMSAMPEEAAALGARLDMYLVAAVAVLERYRSASVPLYPVLSSSAAATAASRKPMFHAAEPTLGRQQAAEQLDSVSCRLAARLRCGGQLHSALDRLNGLTSPESAFERGLTLLAISDQKSGSDSREYLRQAKEAFYLTLDRLRGHTGSHGRPGLESDLAAYIRQVESKLLDDVVQFDRRVNGTLGHDVKTEGGESTPTSSLDASRGGSAFQPTPARLQSGSAVTSTPLRRPPVLPSGSTANGTPSIRSAYTLDNSYSNSVQTVEARPSPERLSSEIRSLGATQEAILHLLMERSTQQLSQSVVAAPPATPQQQQLPSIDELCARVERIVREPITHQLDAHQRCIEQLQKEMSELRIEMARQRSATAEAAATATPAAAAVGAGQMMTPEMYGYMAAAAGQYQAAALRGLQMMPMGYPSTMPYPPAAAGLPVYQGLPLQENDGCLSAALGGLMQQPFASTPDNMTSSTAVLSDMAGHHQLSFTPVVDPVTSVSSVAPAAASRPAQHKTSAGPPANVTVSAQNSLPSLSTTAAVATPPAVLVPPEHRKHPITASILKQPTLSSPTMSTAASPASQQHSYQISLPTGAQLLTSSPFDAQSDKPAFSTVSTLPHIPAPEFSAVSPAYQSPGGKSPGRERINSTGSFNEDPEYDPMSDFKPVVPLPELVEVITGEEGDCCLFSNNCKLFRFVDGEWKERGVGEIRVLHRLLDGRARIIMRRHQTHRVCANHFLLAEMEINQMKNQPRAYVWAAKDFSDEEVKDEKLCARFKNEVIAEEFHQAFNKGKDLIKSSPPKTLRRPSVRFSCSGAPTSSATATTSSPSTPAASTVSAGMSIPTTVVPSMLSFRDHSATAEDDEDDDEYATDEEESTDQSSDGDDDESSPAVACKPQFNFSSIAAPSTAGSISSSGFSFGFGSAANSMPTAAAAPSGGFRFGDKVPKSAAAAAQSTTSFGFSTPASAPAAAVSAEPLKFGGFSFTTKPTVVDSELHEVSAAKDVKTDTKTTKVSPSKPGPFAGFSFGSLTQQPTTPPVFGVNLAPSAGAADSTAAPSAPKSVFGAGSSALSVDFASAAKTGSGFNTADSFKGFTGAGKSVFSGSAVVSESADDSGQVDEYEPNVEFQPVIPLPELVELKTGEEGEKELFRERAKLYRLDAETKEWKERGTGDMKLLHNADTGRYRVLMRRTQVLKLCANHAISEEMELQPLSSSDKAWVWSALDFSEGEANREMLAVKFKNAQLAQTFRDVFESCQVALRQNPPTAASTVAAAQSTPAASSRQRAPTPSRLAASISSLPSPASSSVATSITSTATPSVATSITSTATPSVVASSFVFGSPAPSAAASSGFVFGSGGPSQPAAAATSSVGSSGFGSQFHFSGVKPKSPLKPRSREASLNETPLNNGTAGDDESEYYEHDEGEHLMFEPVIPLPDKVDVKTGEEDDTVLYSHRSKLYRYDQENSEWKERGLGDIKLLQNPDTGRVRVLMRREPVLKLCLNHRLTSELSFALKESDRSVIWATVDYADGEASNDLLAARFKTADIAADFLQHVKDAQSRLDKQPTNSTTATPTRPVTSASATQPSTPAAPGSSAKDSFSFRAPTLTADASPSIFGGGGGTPSATAAASPGSGFSFGSRFGAETSGVSGSPSLKTTSLVQPPASPPADDGSDDDVKFIGEVLPTAAQRAAAERLQLPAGFYLYEQRPSCPGCRGCRDEMPGEEKTGGVAVASRAAAAPVVTAKPTSSPFTFSFTPGSANNASTSSTSVADTTATDANSFRFSFTPAAADKQPAAAATASPAAVFGATKPGSSGFVFGNASAGAPAFGSGVSVTPAAPLFGGSTTPAAPLFGVSTTPAASVFGGSTTPAASVFGGSTTPAASVFGGSTTPAASVFGGSTTPAAIAFGGSTTPAASVFGKATTPAAPVFGGSKAVFDSGFGGLAAPKTNVLEGIKPVDSVSGGAKESSASHVMFAAALQKSGPVLDFASLATGGDVFTNKDAAGFQFVGAGKSVFGASTSQSRPADDNDDSAADHPQDDTHDPHFEPIVPLPDLVDVKTGEEDDQIMFCARALLYRFDSDQWKERGRGDIKILRNKQTGNHRILLRREQVHKLACNHRLTADMELTRLGTSDRAWVWSAVDYADEEPKPETLAVKFKSDALASEFHAAFGAAVEAICAANSDQQDQQPQQQEEEEEEGANIMFEERLTLYAINENVVQELGTGVLRVIYDDDIFCVRITLSDEESGDQLCDCLITMRHVYQIDGTAVEWTAADVSCNPAQRRRYRVFLETEEQVDLLVHAMLEGLEIAQGSDIDDPPEINTAHPDD